MKLSSQSLRPYERTKSNYKTGVNYLALINTTI